MSKRKKLAEKLLRAIEFESVPLSTNKGRMIRNDHCPNKMNSKNRRHKAWVTARWAKPGKYKEAIAEGTDATYFYDEWQSVKDGLHYDPDRTHIRSRFMSAGDKHNLQENNQRLIKLLQRRKARQEKEKLKNYSNLAG
jgi:hypothetical protein